MLFQIQMDELSATLSILTAMITPAVLISASGTLILSTSTRLARTVDRVRTLLSRLEELAHGTHELELFDQRQEVIYKQLELTTKRNRLLQRGMVAFYVALSVFVATSVAIGMVAATGRGYYWLPAALGLSGACFLFYGSVLLIFETRLATQSMVLETNFTLKLSREFVPEEVIEEIDAHNSPRLKRLIRLVRKK